MIAFVGLIVGLEKDGKRYFSHFGIVSRAEVPHGVGRVCTARSGLYPVGGGDHVSVLALFECQNISGKRFGCFWYVFDVAPFPIVGSSRRIVLALRIGPIGRTFIFWMRLSCHGNSYDK